MKMFKRLAAVLLAGVMVLAMLTACGGSDTSAIGEEFETRYMTCINAIRGDDAKKLENDSAMRNKALALLNNIDADGLIDANKAYVTTSTPSADGKMVTVELEQVVVTGQPVDGKYTAAEITPETVSEIVVPDNVDSNTAAMMKMVNKIGIATKEINGKTYAALAIEMTMPAQQ